MKRLSVAPVLASLVLALATWTTTGVAQAAEADGWHSGFCAEGEGLAIVIDFRDMDRDDWPSPAGYDVRCLFGPQVRTLDLSDPTSETFRVVPKRAGVSIPDDSSYAYYGLEGDTRASSGRVGAGWSSSGIARNESNVDRFIGFTYTERGRTTPIIQPQLASAGGDSGQSPPPGKPSTGGNGEGGTPDRVGGGTPDRVGDPGRAGDDDESGDPDDPDARAPGGEAGAEEAEATPEPTASPESDEVVTGQSQEIESTDSLTGGPTWLWVVVIALVVLVYLGVTWLVLRARKAARLAADS